jgi:hypothetical protein
MLIGAELCLVLDSVGRGEGGGISFSSLFQRFNYYLLAFGLLLEILNKSFDIREVICSNHKRESRAIETIANDKI